MASLLDYAAGSQHTLLPTYTFTSAQGKSASNKMKTSTRSHATLSAYPIPSRSPPLRGDANRLPREPPPNGPISAASPHTVAETSSSANTHLDPPPRRAENSCALSLTTSPQLEQLGPCSTMLQQANIAAASSLTNPASATLAVALSRDPISSINALAIVGRGATSWNS